MSCHNPRFLGPRFIWIFFLDSSARVCSEVRAQCPNSCLPTAPFLLNNQRQQKIPSSSPPPLLPLSPSDVFLVKSSREHRLLPLFLPSPPLPSPPRSAESATPVTVPLTSISTEHLLLRIADRGLLRWCELVLFVALQLHLQFHGRRKRPE